MPPERQEDWDEMAALRDACAELSVRDGGATFFAVNYRPDRAVLYRQPHGHKVRHRVSGSVRIGEARALVEHWKWRANS
jgi:hypothetical protein